MSKPVLVGMYDSPFVRRVAVTMQFYRLPYEHQPWSVFSNPDQVRRYNPLGRVPALMIDDDEVLVESASILDYLDELVGPERALLPRSGVERRHQLRLISTALGACEKAVAIVYETEKRAPGTQDPHWLARLHDQVEGAVAWLEPRVPALKGRPNQAQLTSAVAIRFLHGYLPDFAAGLPVPNLDALSSACERLPEFQAAPFSE